MFGIFEGSSPCDAAIRRQLGIPMDADAHLIEWKVTLYRDTETGSPTTHHLHYRYGLSVPGRPGLAATAKTLERRGQWNVVRGAQARPNAAVYELQGAVSLLKVSESVVQVLNRDRGLMIGDGGWSYSLNRHDASEPRVDPFLAAAGPDVPRTISPLSTGPTVFGVFEGRSPCHGIARELQIAVGTGCSKAKWRFTLYHDPETRQPTTYKVEGTLYGSTAREGRWTMVSGTESDPSAIVYHLAPGTTEPAIFLLRGDDNVLFFMDRNRLPMTGNAEFSYTLNRRQLPAPTRTRNESNGSR